jgi:hypothetical protein
MSADTMTVMHPATTSAAGPAAAGSDARQPGDVDVLPRANPFATARVRPGRIPYVFRAGDAVGAVVDRLAAGGGRGQIVGPHGSGKSTLLAAVTAELARRGRGVISTALHDGRRRLPAEFARSMAAAPAGTVAIIDGFEQLPWWRRHAVAWRCRRRGLSLVVTCHASVGLPTLLETAVSADLAWEIVLSLMPDAEALAGPDEVARLLAVHSGSLRDVLFALYDRFEAARPGLDRRDTIPAAKRP